MENNIEIDESEKVYRNVVVTDKKNPIIILFGPTNCGKTTVLIRMIRYFMNWKDSSNKNPYNYVLDRAFRKGDAYEKMCEKMDEFIKEDEIIPANTPPTEYLLAKITENGRTIFQFLEAPGEHWVPMPDKKTIRHGQEFEKYIKDISHLPNKRIWVFFFNLNWNVNDEDLRKDYLKRIENAKKDLVKPKDSVIIMINQADVRREFFGDDNRPRFEQFVEEVKNSYNNGQDNCITMFDEPFLIFWKKGPRKVVFSSGSFEEDIDDDNKEKWYEGPKFYCDDFFKAINDAI